MMNIRTCTFSVCTGGRNPKGKMGNLVICVEEFAKSPVVDEAARTWSKVVSQIDHFYFYALHMLPSTTFIIPILISIIDITILIIITLKFNNYNNYN